MLPISDSQNNSFAPTVTSSPWPTVTTSDWPSAAPDDNTQQQSAVPPESSAPSLSEVIDAAINAIAQGCTPEQLDKTANDLCAALVAAGASEIISDGAFNRLNAQLSVLKIHKVTQKTWREKLKIARANYAINNPTGEADAAPGADLPPLADSLPGAPAAHGTVVPARWKVNENGVQRVGLNLDEEVLPTPLIITERLADDGDSTEWVKLSWRRDGDWKHHVCTRDVIATKRAITDLSKIGMPVNSLNADNVIAYLSDFENANLGVLPRVHVRQQLGWVDGQMSGFLWGREYITADEPAPAETAAQINPFATTSDAPHADAVAGPAVFVFRGAAEGDEQAADAYKARGTLDGWRAAVGPALAYPVPRLALQASLGAPMLQLLADQGAANFTGDFCGETSSGKTTTLRLAVSAWGRADLNGGASVMTTWQTTRVGAERRAGLVNGLPIARDDTKQARNPEEIAQFLYDIGSGRTRDRGTVKGLDRSTSFTTIMLTTGETRAVSHSGDGGTRARVLTLWVPPYEKADETTAALVKDINAGVLQHYGHAGPAFVRYVLRHRDQWPAWRQRYVQLRAEYLTRAQGNPVVGRLGDAFALITLTGELAAEALAMPTLAASPIEDLWGVLTAEASDADRATAALLHVYDWASANREEFHGAGEDQPHGGWAGHWGLSPTYPRWQFLGFMPKKLTDILRESGYDTDAVISSWKDRGWLLIDKSDTTGRYHQVSLEGQRPRVVAIRRHAFEQVCCLPTDEHEQRCALLGLGNEFLVGVQTPPKVGDAQALARAVQAVQAWQATLLATPAVEATPVATPAVPAAEEGDVPF
jgi:hypothetical protein